jgi:hypothetical protein
MAVVYPPFYRGHNQHLFTWWLINLQTDCYAVEDRIDRTLYLIGSNICRATLQIVGVRPFLQGTLLWVIVTGLSLILVYWGIIVG